MIDYGDLIKNSRASQLRYQDSDLDLNIYELVELFGSLSLFLLSTIEL